MSGEEECRGPVRVLPVPKDSMSVGCGTSLVPLLMLSLSGEEECCGPVRELPVPETTKDSLSVGGGAPLVPLLTLTSAT